MANGERTGIQIANYRLGRLLGKGGFAEVYEAEHAFLGTKAAVKLLLTSFVSETDIQNFLQEARTIATLNHPNIVHMLDFGIDSHEATPYLLMDFAPGGSLRNRHPAGTQVPLMNVVSYTRQAASALQFAHDAQVVHRDVKPENMLIGARGDVLLSDFGIAVANHSTRSARADNAAGTAPYMAPEQISGQPRRSGDQYALAVTVYEWLAGYTPFHGTMEEIFAQKFYGSPTPLSSLVAVHPYVEAVVMRGMAKIPEQRYPSITEFANALEQAAAGRSTEILPPPPPPVPTLSLSNTSSMVAPPPANIGTPPPAANVVPRSLPPVVAKKKANYGLDAVLIITFTAALTLITFLVGNAGKPGIQPSPGTPGHIVASGPNGVYLYILFFGLLPLAPQLAGKSLGMWRGTISTLLYIIALNIITLYALPKYVTSSVFWNDMLILSPMLLISLGTGIIYTRARNSQDKIGCGAAGLVSYVAAVVFWLPALFLSNGFTDYGTTIVIALVLAIPIGLVGGLIDMFLFPLVAFASRGKPGY